MKRILSIPLVLLIAFSGISLKLATHYCRGNAVDTKVSLSGRHATCGMEHHRDFNNEVTLRSLCCEDRESEYTINNIFISSSSFPDFSGQKVIQHNFFSTENLTIKQFPAINFLTVIRPPGTPCSNSDLLPVLCAFRI